jgi:hypothetical protein
MKPTFSRLDDATGLRAYDPIEDARFDLFTDRPVTPEPASTDAFAFHVDRAVRIAAASVVSTQIVNVIARDDEGRHLAGASGSGFELGDGRYNVEVASAGLKLYLVVDGPVSVGPAHPGSRIEFDGVQEVLVGVRSLHESPVGTVTTTRDPVDVMRAVSTFGSALKTTSPERTFPTLRGHPPLVEVGETFSVPDTISSPETGVTVEVPAELGYVYPTVSLAYLLGATVEPGPEPRLVTDSGYVRPLDGDDGFETAVRRTLQQTFLLDCITRTEGFYQVPLHERSVVEPRVDLDFAALYDRPLTDRLAAYLDVPWSAIADAVPRWKLTGDVRPRIDYAGVLPFLAMDLAVVRCPVNRGESEFVEEPPELTEFYRAPPDQNDGQRPDGEPAWSSRQRDPPTVVQPDDADSIEQVWVGDGFPVSAAKTSEECYRRRLEKPWARTDSIRVVVVCNDEEMREEGAVVGSYGDRDLFEFDVDVRYDTTAAELADLLADDVQFLHYVGHVDQRGLQCADGFLDAETLSDVNMDAFLLNACESYRQGWALVEAGALGGVATLSKVGNTPATEVGESLARLLNMGFSLSAAIDVVAQRSLTASQYTVVGDGDRNLVKTDSGLPMFVEVERADDGYDVTVNTYLNNYGMGPLFTPKIGDDETRYLGGGWAGSYKMNGEELREYLDGFAFAVEFHGSLRRSTEVELGYGP